MSQLILLIAPEVAAHPVAAALRSELDAAVEIACNRRAGLAALRRAEYALVVLDENLAAANPGAADLLYQNALSAPVLEINFVISSAARIVRQARSTMARSAHDRAQARVAAAATLQSELSASLTGLLLESQLALRAARPDQASKLRHVVQLAGNLRDRLRTHP
jgi:signal transduction histidine kinase